MRDAITKLQIGIGGVNESGNIRSRYESLTITREPFLERAEDVAEITIPHLMPRDRNKSGRNAGDLPTPYQSVGARGINNLAAKLLLALLPPGDPFFRLVAADPDLQSLQEIPNGEDVKGKVEKALGGVERRITGWFERIGLRTTLYEALRQLIVAGNDVLLTTDTGVRTFRLDEFVVRRDNEGRLIEVIIHEELSALTLGDEILSKLAAEDLKVIDEGKDKSSVEGEPIVNLYTQVRWDVKKKNWEQVQELQGVILEETRGRFSKEQFPWVVLRFNRIDGEDYGRGFGEEYLGDLQSLEGLEKAMVEYAAQAARVIHMFNENGQTDIDDFNEAENGDAIEGDAADHTVIGIDKFNDMAFVERQASKIERRLSMAFLLNSSVTRDAERVTAEEVRLTASELEDTLGGVYSILSQELQLPLVRQAMVQLIKSKELPRIDQKDVNPQIITGLEALGRTRDLEKLRTFAALSNELLGQEVTSTYLKPGDFLDRLSTALALNMDGATRSEEEVAELRQTEQMQSLIEQLGPNAVTQIGQLVQQQQQNPQGGTASEQA